MRDTTVEALLGARIEVACCAMAAEQSTRLAPALRRTFAFAVLDAPQCASRLRSGCTAVGFEQRSFALRFMIA